MYINNLCSDTHLKSVTITLTYDDIRDLANGMSEAAEKNPKYTKLAKRLKDVFSLTKEGICNSWLKEEKET